MKRISYILFPITLFFSCSSIKKNTREYKQLPPVTISSTSTDYKATAIKYWDIKHTRIALSFNFKEKTAIGEAWLTISPYFYPSKQVVLDAKGMVINTVKINNTPAEFVYKNDSLTLNLNKTYQNHEQLNIYVSYIAQPYQTASGGGKAITDDRGLYFINTDYSIPNKPAQIWTQGETEANSHWMPTIDKPNQRFTTQIELTVPDSFVTLSNGRLIDQKHNNGLRTDIWRMGTPIQTYVCVFAIGKYHIVEDSAWNGIPINYYVEPEYAQYAKNMFKNTREMIAYFSKITNIPYPWDKYSQVVVRDYVSGAMENTSATVFGEFVNQTDREIADNDFEDVVAHELFHQWFGDYVTAESWSNITLNESFANYGEQLWRRHKYGQASELVLAYEDLQSYLLSTEKADPPLARYYYNDKDDVFDRISYQKGGAILRYLEGIIGSDAFNLSMEDYLKTNKINSAEIDNWRLSIEKITGKDMHWFFNQWYMRGGHPKLDLKYGFDDNSKELTLTVTQKQDNLYRLPLIIELVSGNKRKHYSIDIDNRTLVVKYPYPGEERPVLLPDTEHWLVGTINDNKNFTEWLQHYNACPSQDFISKQNALQACSKNLSNTTVQELYKLALKDDLRQIRLYALEYILESENKSVRKALLEDIKSMAMNDSSNAVRSTAYYALGEWKIEDIKQDMIKTLYDSSYLVASSALYALNIIDKDTAYLLAKQLAKTQPGGDLRPEIWITIGEYAAVTDTTYFNNELYNVSGRKKIDFVNALALYMKNVSSDAAFEAMLKYCQYLVTTENIKTYRSAMAGFLFELSKFYKYEVKATNTKNTTAKASTRYNKLKSTMTSIVEMETDEKNKGDYQMLMLDIF